MKEIKNCSNKNNVNEKIKKKSCIKCLKRKWKKVRTFKKSTREKKKGEKKKTRTYKTIKYNIRNQLKYQGI